MPKEHHKHHKGELVKLAGSPEKLIDLIQFFLNPF
jgi:hypothetical protein